MVSSNAVVLCTYSYDPLDRLAGASPGGSDSVQRFYQKGDLTTEIQGQIQRAVFQSEDHLLARQQLQSGQTGCALLGTDQQRSVLHSLDPAQQRAFAYSPYGFRPPQLDLPGFNGEQPDRVTGHYLLGNGYRAFNPILMRFNSPDSLSPFGDGGLNAYAYCVGDPVNRVDPTGHVGGFWQLVKASLPRIVKMAKTPATKNYGSLSKFIDGRPHLIEKIVGYLPGNDMVRLAVTSKDMKSVVSLLSTEAIKKTAVSVSTIAKGNAMGILPAHGITFVKNYDAVMQQISIRHTAKMTQRSLPSPSPRRLNIRRGAIFSPD